MSEFTKEKRYIVFKISHLDEEQLEFLERVQREVPTIGECVVVESDWPEYEKVWKMIEERVSGKGKVENMIELISDRLASYTTEETLERLHSYEGTGPTITEFVDEVENGSSN